MGDDRDELIEKLERYERALRVAWSAIGPPLSPSWDAAATKLLSARTRFLRELTQEEKAALSEPSQGEPSQKGLRWKGAVFGRGEPPTQPPPKEEEPQ